MKPALILLTAILLTIALSASFHSQSPDSSTHGLVCNSSPRTCLDYTLNIYLKALLIHKPEALPVADNVRFAENGVVRKLGEGLWKSITNEIMKSDELEIGRILHLKFRNQETSNWTSRTSAVRPI